MDETHALRDESKGVSLSVSQPSYHKRMSASRPTAAALFVLLLGALLPAQGTSGSRALRDRAADLTYNLDYDAALRLLRQAVAQAPDDPANHRAVASTLWLEILFARGDVTVDHYLGSMTQTGVGMKPPPAALDAEFKRELARCIELAEARVKQAPNDAQAHFDLGAGLGLQASYIASVEGRLMAGFRAARRSYDEQERVLELDPHRKDAELIVGTYRYLVSTLSMPMRLLAYAAGFGGGKERGLHMVEDAAQNGGESRTDAEFALVLLYNRERHFDEAIRVMTDLRARYPRNRLVLLEAGATATRGGRPAEAETLLTQGIAMLAHDDRPRIPGEDALWHYKRGTTRVMLHRREEALADLRLALEPGAAPWVQGRAHVEMARLAEQQGDRAGAARESALATGLCERGHDPTCLEDARRVIR